MTQIFNTIPELQTTLNDWHDKGEKIAFVPTMGGLHQGHLSLIGLVNVCKLALIPFIKTNDTKSTNYCPF